ncbi:MAG: AAA family ATPase [Alphaproteobacteria bacterium]|nr:AAA family ATPase [Alphaproteobacteria bacterium]
MGLELKLPSLADSIETRFLACVEDAQTHDTVSRLVAELGWHAARVCEGGIAAAPAAIDPAVPPSILLVDLGEAADPFRALDRLAEHCPPETKVLAIGAMNDVAPYRRLLAIGPADYLVKPVSAEALRETLLHVMRPVERKEAAPASPAKSARLLALVGARGGVGTSTLAAGIAWCLSEEQRLRVALLDIDLQFGNLALSLDLEPGRGLREALEHPERIDSLLIAGAMNGTSERLRVLAAEEPLDDQPRLDPSAVDPLVAALADNFEYIVADVPRGLDGMGRRILARADKIVIVSDLSLAAMRDTQRLATLVEILQPNVKPLVFINRAGALARCEIARPEFEKGIGRKIDGVIPHDAKAATAMAQHAKPLPVAAKSGKAAIELRRLTTLLAGATKAPPRSFMKRWLG